ncbi:Multidrug resistance-associated protein 1, partial [Quaeritorhiza haematococci]
MTSPTSTTSTHFTNASSSGQTAIMPDDEAKREGTGGGQEATHRGVGGSETGSDASSGGNVAKSDIPLVVVEDDHEDHANGNIPSATTTSISVTDENGSSSSIGYDEDDEGSDHSVSQHQEDRPNKHRRRHRRRKHRSRSNKGRRSSRSINESPHGNDTGETEDDDENGERRSSRRRRSRSGRKKGTSRSKGRRRKRRKFVLAPSNIISSLLFLWVFKLVGLFRRTSNLSKINLSLRSTETAKVTGDVLCRTWDEEKKRSSETQNGDKHQNPSLLRALYRAFGLRYFLLAIWKVLWAVFTWFSAYLILFWLVHYSETQHGTGAGAGGGRAVGGDLPQPRWMGYLYATALCLSCAMASICFHQLTIQSTKIGVQCRAALMVLIYRKSLRLSYVKGGIGDIVNLVSNECNRIAEACVNWHFLWSAAVECSVIIALTIVDVGIAAAIPAMILILLVLLPLQYWFARLSSLESYHTTALITKRVHLMSEVLTTIRLIKFYGWEPYCEKRIQGARDEELKGMRKGMMMKIAGFMVVFMAPNVAALACFAAYFLVKGGDEGVEGVDFKASTVFALLGLFNTLRYPLLMLPLAVRSIVGASTSLHRLEDFFKLPEVDALTESSDNANREKPTASAANKGTDEDNREEKGVTKVDGQEEKEKEEREREAKDVLDQDICFEAREADFVWDGDLDHPHITSLTLTLRKRHILAVVGDIGSGKSLLAAIMRQLKLVRGTVRSHGSTCGYVPQEPWLINASLRDNILFGKELDERRYSEVVRVCGLTRDMMLLSNGDESFVGDLNLSASQRQRLSLARCMYHDPDIVLLEDCLSDFDQSTAKRIFKEVVKNQLLNSKAVVLFTQQKQFLPDCDQILVMKNGHVIEGGTFAELKARKVNFSTYVSDYVPIEDDPTGLLDQ